LIAVRLARPEDAAAIVALVNAAYRGDSSRAGWTTEADLLGGQRTDAAAIADFIAGAPQQRMLVHEAADGALHACVQLQNRGDYAYLGMLTIRPTLQAAGLGRALLTAAERDVQTHWGSQRMVMTVIEQRRELIAWYERRGYVCTGETAAFPYGDPRFGEPKRADLRFVVLAKELPVVP
jgi:ribosomal protein S18 acetylase RimI-like enzyme